MPSFKPLTSLDIGYFDGSEDPVVMFDNEFVVDLKEFMLLLGRTAEADVRVKSVILCTLFDMGGNASFEHDHFSPSMG